MKKKGLKTKLVFEFEIDEEMPDIDYDIPLEKNKINKEIKIVVKKKKNVRDPSSNTGLF